MIRVRISLCTLLAILFGCSTTLAAPPEGKPVLVPMWKNTTIGLPENDNINFDVHKPAVKWLSDLYGKTKTAGRNSGRAQIPPAVPKAMNGLVCYVNDHSIAALLLREHRIGDEVYKFGEVLWASVNDYFYLYYNRGSQETLDDWLKEHGNLVWEMPFNHTLRCSFIVHGQTIHHIEEIAILPPASQMKRVLKRKEIVKKLEKDEWQAALGLGNEVRQLDTQSGKLTGKMHRDYRQLATASPFGGNMYLGAPLTVGKQAFTVHEKRNGVRLTSIDWQKVRKASHDESGDWRFAEVAASNKTFAWDTELANAPTPIFLDPHRRIHAIHLVENKGQILCPTHLGRVVAVDSKTGKIQWTHEYAPLDAKRFPTFAPEWVVVPPTVVGDKYIIAPADFPELLCLNVADGKKVWSVKKGDGLYPAVVGEQVLVIGEKTLRSLSLKDGSEQWKLDLPGLPCGRGTMLGDKYLLPFSELKTWKGMIAIVDLKAGKILEVLKPEKDEPIGNLVVHQEFLISQTLTEIAVFPIRK